MSELSAFAISPDELLMEEVSALDTAGAAHGSETEPNHIVHGCEAATPYNALSRIAVMIFPLATTLDAR
jgi:hypothetical protein